MAPDAVDRVAVLVLDLLDLDPVGVVRAHLVQGDQVGDHQEHQHQRERDHVQREEAVEGDVRDEEVTADPLGQVRADQRQRAEQRHDHLRAPVGHVAPGEQVAEERHAHHHQVDDHAEDPQQLARLAVGAVEHGAEHVQVDDDEERRGAGRMQVTDQPAPLDVAHDVLDGAECLGCRGLVAHRQEDAGDDLDHQREQRQGTEQVPQVEVFRGVVLAPLLVPKLGQGETIIHPAEERLHPATAVGGRRRVVGHHAALAWSSPTRMRLSSRKVWGGIDRLVGAGMPLNTRPARSNLEPWHGQ